MWGKHKPNWQKRVVGAFDSLIKRAKSEISNCQMNANWSEEEDEDRDDDEVRGLADVCKNDARTIRPFFNKFRRTVRKLHVNYIYINYIYINYI